ncbi:MAG: VOC family protein [Myxococcota bacterium]
MSNLSTVEIKAFVPATNYARSMAFYRALGFEVRSDMGDLAYLVVQNTSFLLQHYPQPQFAQHFQMHLLVEDVDAWHAHVLASGVVDDFGIEVGSPEDQPWGMRDFVLFDPSGVLWRIAKNIRSA